MHTELLNGQCWGYTPQPMRDIILITGTSSGIGLATAVACAKSGFQVIATMRNLEREDELRAAFEADGLDGAIEQLDVTNPELDERVREFVLKYGPIYGLVNNAGIAVGGAFEEQSEADVRDQFETNVFGALAVTRALLPAMRAAGRGRIVNVSSIAGQIAFPGLAVYGATKHALSGFTEALRLEVEQFGVQVCLVEPGTFKTPIFFGNQRRGALMDGGGPYAELTQVLEKIILTDAENAPGPEVVAENIARLLGEAAPAQRTVIGRDARAMAALRKVIPESLFTSGMRRFLGLPPGPSRSR